MKHHFFQEGIINFDGDAGLVDLNGANGIVFGAITTGEIVFGKIDAFADIAVGRNAGEIVFNDIGIQFGGAVKQLSHPIVGEALQSISDPSTTSLDLSGAALSDHNLSVIYQSLPTNQNISFINFSNNPLITARSVIHLYNIHNHGVVSADFTDCGIDLALLNGQLAELSIYQSPLVSCRFGAVNLLSVKAETATAILSTLHSFLGPKSSFDISNPEHRQSLVHFFKSPKAQKALKWLSENSQDPDLVFKGDAFVKGLQSLRDYNLFHLKGVCKTVSDKESCLILHDALPNILSYLSFDDILRSPPPIIEETVLVGEEIT